MRGKRLKIAVDHLSELKGALVALGVTHPMHPDSVRDRHVLHVLGSDEDVLLAIRRLGGIDLKKRTCPELGNGVVKKDIPLRTHHHLHTDTTIDGIHEYIKFV